MKKNRTVDDILQSTSDVLFPAASGEQVVALNSRGSDGDTPLHVMTWRGDRAAVRALVDAGAEIDAIGDMGQTALHVAVMNDDDSVAEILLAAGASPDVRSEFGDTPFELAQEKGDKMKRLFKHRAQQRVAADRAKPCSG